MKRGLTVTLVTALSLVVISITLVISSLLLIFATEKGTKLAWQQAQPFLPETLAVHSLEGCLAGPLEIRGLKVKSKSFHLEIDSIKLEWLPKRLFGRVLDVDNFAMEGVHYTQLDSAPPIPPEASKPLRLPEAIALSLDFRLGKVSLDNFEFRSMPDGDPFVIDSATLAATANTQEVDISSLNIKAPLFAVEGQARLTTNGNYDLQGEFNWRVPVPDYPALKVQTLLDGSLRELTIHQTIEKPYVVQGEVLLKNPVDNLTFEAALKVNELKLQTLNENLPPVTVQLDVTGKGNPNDIAFNLNGWAEESGQGRVNVATEGGFKSQTITVNHLKITVPEQTAQLTATGQIALNDQQQLSLTADWQQLLWPLEQPKIISPKGHAAVAGKIEDYSVKILASVVVPDQTDGELRIEGHGSHDSLDVSRVDIHALEGTLKGKAKFSWMPELNGTIELDGYGLNPGVLKKEWPGNLGVTLRAQGGVQNKQPSLQLPQLKVQGQLRGYELSLDAAGAYEKNLAILERLALSSGSTQLNASGTIGDRLDVSWMVQSADLGTLLPKAKGRLDGKGTLAGAVKLPQITANLTAEDLVYSAYDLKALDLMAKIENQRIDIALDWQNLQWPLEQPKIMSPKGHVDVAGQIEDYSVKILANVVVPDQTEGELRIEGHGSQDSLDVSRVDINALEGTLKGKAKFSWKPELNGTIELDGYGFNPGVFNQEWPGNLGVTLRAQGGVQNQQPSLQLPQLKVQGQLRGYELSLDAAGTYEKNLAILKRLALSSGSTQLNASGTIGDRLDVSWMVQSADLGTLLPKAKGRLDGKGTLAGAVKFPQITANLTAEDLVYSDYNLKALDLMADIDLAGKNQSKLSLMLQEGNAAGIQLRKIDLKSQGNSDDHTFTLAADTSRGQIDINLQGMLHNPWQQNTAWDFKLEQVKLKYPDLDGWVLLSPSTGHITASEKQLSQSCWQSGEALLCFRGQQSAEAIQANFELTDLPFSYFAKYLPPDISLQGELSGKGALNKTGRGNKEPSVTVNLNTTKVRLLSGGPDNEQQQKDELIIDFQPGDIHLELEQGGLQASIKLPLSETDGIDLQAKVAPGGGPLIERPLKGQINAEIEDLAFIADLIPEVQKLSGRLKGDIALTGSLASPLLKGRIGLIEGAASLDRPGLNLKDIRVDLSGEGDGGIRLTAHAATERGVLNIDGTADLSNKTTKADIKVKGENFRVIDTVKAQADVSPDLTIALRGTRVDVGGEIVFPRAKINIKTLPESAVKVSDDQIIILSNDQEKPAGPTGRETYARVRIILGDDVNFNGFGLNARIEGNLLAVEKPGEPTTGSGELIIVDGKYRAYGQGLIIEKGRIVFAGGPISQPGVEVRAVRRPEKDILVGVQVKGNLRQPDFTTFSDPVMTQGNQLSYLVLGRPLSGSSGGEDSVLSRAALAMSLKGGNALATKIGGKLGLDQFAIDSGEAGSASTPEQASFVIGKYLSPKLYVSYGLGLFNPISTLRLKYALSSRWQLVTESSSAASGGDIIYTIETGK